MNQDDVRREIGRMTKNKMLERFAAQSLVEVDGELIFSKERFAELIVEECVNVADENYIHRGSRTCGLAIRLHFGVLE